MSNNVDWDSKTVIGQKGTFETVAKTEAQRNSASDTQWPRVTLNSPFQLFFFVRGELFFF